MRGSRKFCQRGSNSDNVIWIFFVDEGRTDDLYSIVFSNKSGPVLIIKQYFCDFLGGCPDPLPPSGSAHVLNSLDSVDAGVAIVFVFFVLVVVFLEVQLFKVLLSRKAFILIF